MMALHLNATVDAEEARQTQRSADAKPIPRIDRELPDEIKTATFAMG